GRFSLRRPRQHFSLALSERRDVLRGCADQATHTVESIKSHEMNGRLAGRGNLEIDPRHRYAGLIAVEPVDRDNKSSLEAALRSHAHDLKCARVLLMSVGRLAPYKGHSPPPAQPSDRI